MASGKTLIGYQASSDEVEKLDQFWKKRGAQSRSLFLRELVERELAGQQVNEPLPVEQDISETEPMPPIREELAALAYVVLSCWQKAPSSSAAKEIVKTFLLSGLAIEQLKEESV